LSSEDRFTQPQAFETSADSDYLENQCAARKLFLLCIALQNKYRSVNTGAFLLLAEH